MQASRKPILNLSVELGWRLLVRRFICPRLPLLNGGTIFFLSSLKQLILLLTLPNKASFDQNKAIYESKEVVEDAFREPLQEHEKTILSLLKGELPKMRMLDLGVGTGRTTRYFAGLAKEYIGVDYSSAMVAACCRIFADQPNLSFLTLDARDMKDFSEGYFDFVLFSYNGIDYVDHDDRLRILHEVRRVTRKGGYFCFSAHNLDYLELYSLKLSAHPTVLLRRLIGILQMRLANGKAWKTMRDIQSRRRYAILNDGVFRYSLLTYYVTAEEQVEQLKEAEFYDIRLFRMVDGMELKRSGDYVSPWLYYLAKVA